MKKLFSLVMVLVLALVLVACTKVDEQVDGNDEESFEIAVVTDVGQLRDGGFNQGTYEGAKAYAEKNNKSYKYYQPANGANATDADRVAAMNLAIENGAKVIVTPGFLQQSAINTVATANPDVKFIFIDGWNFGLKNVTAVSYKEEESGYLAGYAAAKDGYTKFGGTFGGGGSNAACNRFAYGYAQGIAAVAAANPEVNYEITISFNYGSSFSASTELQTQISNWYKNGVEVVFSCGGSMLQSVKAAAAETQNGKIIGVDVDQAKESDRVITSAVKGLKESVEKILGEYYAGKWDAQLADKCSNLGAADNATGIPTAEASWRFTKFTVAEYNELFTKLQQGQVTIDNQVSADSMNKAASWDTFKGTLSKNVTLTIEE